MNERYLKWTETAIYCYSRGCRCNGCIIKKVLETKCLMKMTVIEIVKKHGKPPKRRNNMEN